MAGAWKSPLNYTHKEDDTSFPGLRTQAPEAGAAKIEYEELQTNEVLALEAIYGEDFVNHTGGQSAWKKTEPSFDITIKASSNEDFRVTVGFVMTATYPRTSPLLTIKDNELPPAITYKVQKFIETEPEVFAREGQEMVDKIVEGIRDILEDAAQAKAQGALLPSLEQEREKHEAEMARRAEEQKKEEDRKRLEESKEEERVIAEMLQQQLDRQRQKHKESKHNRRPNGSGDIPNNAAVGSHPDQVDFDQICNAIDRTGNVLSFRSVVGKSDQRQGQVSAVYSVRPLLTNGQSSSAMALKEAVLKPREKDGKEFKKQLQSLEAHLQDLKLAKKLQHRHIVDVFDFKVQSGLVSEPSAPSVWTVSILGPLAEKGSLEELLELAGRLDIGKVRSWTRDLLDGLNYLHNKNLAHQDIHPGNILLFREPLGEIIPKLADAVYQREIHNISTQKQGLPGLTSARSAYWLPPEIAAASRPVYTHKTDIWDFGVVFVQMIFGLDVLKKYSSPRNLMETLFLSHSLQELVSRFFKEDKIKRPRAFELGASEFLATDAPILLDEAAGLLSSTASLSSLPVASGKLRRDSTTRGIVSSRYTEDFVEEGRLGKGGFGEVVKARKKLDGQIYAIKKITQRSQASLTEILKEVRLLSQLSHPAVVRYYNTWVEEIHDTTDTEGETSTEDYTDTRETGSAAVDIQFATSTGGLDFMSSNAAVEFDYSDDESDEADDFDENSTDDEASSEIETGTSGRGGLVSPEKERNAFIQRRARLQRQYKTILYISMEYCEKRVSVLMILVMFHPMLFGLNDISDFATCLLLSAEF